MEYCCRTHSFVIHTKRANIHDFENETMDKIFILYDATFWSYRNLTISCITPAAYITARPTYSLPFELSVHPRDEACACTVFKLVAA